MILREQEIVRKNLCKYIMSEGVNQKHISAKTHISRPVLSKFKTGKVELNDYDFAQLKEFLESKGY